MNYSNNFLLIVVLSFTLGFMACSSDSGNPSKSEETKVLDNKEETADKVMVKEASATLTGAVNEKAVKAEEAIIEIHLTDDEEEESSVSPSETKINQKKISSKKESSQSSAKKLKKSSSKKGPKIVFEQPLHDFGTIKQGDEFQHRFKFENTGKEDLIISNVSASCGCTQPSYPFLPVKPGETGHIDVTYNSTGKMLTQKPTITVVTNASPRTHKLHLSGYVEVEMAKKTNDVIIPDTTTGNRK